jgi:hypothetical protein
VAYLNGSKVLTTGSALVFDGTNLGIGVTSITQKLQVLGNISAFSSSNAGSAGSAIYYLGAADAKADAQFKYDSATRNLSWKTAAGASDMMTLDASGNLLVGTTSQLGTGLLCLKYAGGATSNGLVTQPSVNQYYNPAVFRNFSGTDTGYIQVNAAGNLTIFGTTSDYRLKSNPQPMTNALTKIMQLKPCTYTWKADGSDGEGFIAHELQEVFPDCVTGEKDGTREDKYEITPAVKDEQGNIITPAVIGTQTVPVYQGMDASFLVATLTAAIQELNTKFEEYRAAHP